MESNDREALVEIRERLKNSIENQNYIKETLGEIFDKIDRESKEIASVKGELQTHIETARVRREELKRRLDSIEEQQKGFEKGLEELSEDLSEGFGKEISELAQEVTEGREFLGKEAEKRKLFEKELKTSYKVLAWVVGSIITISGLVLTVIKIVESLNK